MLLIATSAAPSSKRCGHFWPRRPVRRKRSLGGLDASSWSSKSYESINSSETPSQYWWLVRLAVYTTHTNGPPESLLIGTQPGYLGGLVDAGYPAPGPLAIGGWDWVPSHAT